MMNKFILISALLISSGASAEDACDFEHQCYHMDPSNPDKVTPPPSPQYHVPGNVIVHPAQVCRLMYLKTGPEPAFQPQIVELCSMSEEQEQAIRSRVQHFNQGE
jgi:hypothetical protein